MHVKRPPYPHCGRCYRPWNGSILSVCPDCRAELDAKLAHFAHWTIDSANERLRMGRTTPEEVVTFLEIWNCNPDRFHFAQLMGGKILLFPIP